MQMGRLQDINRTKISGPAKVTLLQMLTTSAVTNITDLVQGVYQFQLKVTDNNGATGTDIMQVTVNAAANRLPTADAGFDQIITLPTNSVTVSGAALILMVQLQDINGQKFQVRQPIML